MLRRSLLAAAVGLWCAGPALAQEPAPDKAGIPLNYKPPPTQEEIDQRRAADRAYNAAVQKIPDKKPPADPWGGIRPSTPTASKSKQQ